MLSALWVGWEALSTLGRPSPRPEPYTLAIAAASVLLNEGLYQYSSRAARRTGSRAVLAASWDQRLDALGSLAVLVSLALARWGGWHAADHVAALLVALVILWAGGGLFWGSLQELMDRQAEPDVLEAVRREALAVPGVRGVEKLLVRKTGLEHLVDIHVEVDPDLTVRQGHGIGHAVKDRLVAAIVTVKDVLVHIEPAPGSAGPPAGGT
jgi:cation diffusion facilitator family transporter